MAEELASDGVAYGLRLRGVDPAALLPADQEPWPLVEVRQHNREVPAGEPWLDDHGWLQELDGVRTVRVTRDPPLAEFIGPPLAPADLVHPYLGPVGVVFGRWLGRETFHAGAFVAGGGAWALVGPREVGKSSLLAALAAGGIPVLADDLVVVDGPTAFAGPRSLDLRERPRHRVVGSLDVAPARRNTRWRVRLAPMQTAVELRGWIFMWWGEQVEVERVGAATTLSRLARWRGRPELQTDPRRLLDLARLPAFELRRPRTWDALPRTVELILGVAAEHGP